MIGLLQTVAPLLCVQKWLHVMSARRYSCCELEDKLREDPATGHSCPNGLMPVVSMCCCRWREDTSPGGSPQRQSNARFVQWSDGSWQLLVGDEVLDVKESDIRMDHSFLYARQQGILQVQPPSRRCQASEQAHVGGPHAPCCPPCSIKVEAWALCRCSQ